jgi:hypothetical protein
MAIFQGENNLKQKVREAYMQELFAQHYFKELCKHWKVKGITLKEGLLKWK